MDNKQTNDRMYELALFAGIGGGILGTQLLGHRCVCAVENDFHAQSVLIARQNDKSLPIFPIWDDIRTFDGRPWKGIVDVVSGGFPCFTADTYITTERGSIPIESVVVGDKVLTHKGRWKRITSKMQRENAFVNVIKGTGTLPTYTTNEHPYYCKERINTWNKCTRRYEKIYTDPKWVECKDIKPKAMFAQVLPEIIESEYSIDYWWLVGRYLADGWRVDRKGRKNGRVVICCNKTEDTELETRISKAGFNATRVEERTVIKFHITQGSFYEFLGQFGRLAKGKLIPGWVLSLDTDRARAIFEGWSSGDGWVDTKRNIISVTTISQGLAIGMGLLAQRAYGKVASIYRHSVPSTTEIEGRVVNQNPQFSVKIYLSGNQNKSFIENNYGWKQFNSRVPNGYATVYNISVEDDESYVANGAIVHNCQDISGAGKQKGITGERSGLWGEMSRIIKEVSPRYVFIENSPQLKRLGLSDVLSDLAEMGFDAEWGIIGANNANAPHKRERLWLVAYSKHNGLSSTTEQGSIDKDVQWCKEGQNSTVQLEGICTSSMLSRKSTQREDVPRCPKWWDVEPELDRVANRTPNWMDRIKRIGNAQVPAVARIAFRLLKNRLETK